MANGNALPFELFLRHPSQYSQVLRYWAAPPLLYRLTIDPRQREDVSGCGVDVFWVPRPGGATQQQLQLTCDWSGAESLGIMDPGICIGLPAREITEKAAIGMMALLMPHMERFSVEGVLQVGTGADYEVMGCRDGDRSRIEVSGVYEARYPSDSSGRLREKMDQLLRVNSRGFVSVTTFSYPPDERLHSFLFFVFRQNNAADGNRGATVGTSPNSEREASALALEAEVALYRADIIVAREKHLQAGKVLRRCAGAAQQSKDQHRCRFLAATQYFKAGLYHRALKLTRRIERRLLPDHMAHLFSEFRRQVQQRVRPTYVQSVREKFARLHQRDEYRQIATLLWRHPYVYDRTGTAFIRAYVSFQLQEYRAAGVFAAAAYQFGLNDPSRVIELASLPFGVVIQQGLEAAWEAARSYTKGFPHPLAHLMASALLYQLALSAKGEDVRREWARKQLEFYNKAMTNYGAISRSLLGDPEARNFMVVSAASAAIAHDWLGDSASAADALTAAENASPGNALSRSIIADVKAFLKTSAGTARISIDPPTFPLEAILADARKRQAERWESQVAETVA